MIRGVIPVSIRSSRQKDVRNKPVLLLATAGVRQPLTLPGHNDAVRKPSGAFACLARALGLEARKLISGPSRVSNARSNLRNTLLLPLPPRARLKRRCSQEHRNTDACQYKDRTGGDDERLLHG